MPSVHKWFQSSCCGYFIYIKHSLIDKETKLCPNPPQWQTNSKLYCRCRSMLRLYTICANIYIYIITTFMPPEYRIECWDLCGSVYAAAVFVCAVWSNKTELSTKHTTQRMRWTLTITLFAYNSTFLLMTQTHNVELKYIHGILYWTC